MVSVAKYHGTGNDFIIVDASIPLPDRRAFAIEHCDREEGISHSDSAVGADGVLFLALEDQYSPPRVVMTLVQPDGSVAAMCGNGARCAAAWAARKTQANELMIDTQSGTRRAIVGDDAVRIEMGDPVFTPDHVPLASGSTLIEEAVGGLTVTAVNTGVPHAVAFVEDVDAIDLDSVAPPIRNASVFPAGANVTLASQSESGDGFDQRTFERGVEGETDSCGTGAVAIAAVAQREERIERGEPIAIHPSGGDLEVTITDNGALLSGPVVYGFTTDLPAAKPRRVG